MRLLAKRGHIPRRGWEVGWLRLRPSLDLVGVLQMPASLCLSFLVQWPVWPAACDTRLCGKWVTVGGSVWEEAGAL